MKINITEMEDTSYITVSKHFEDGKVVKTTYTGAISNKDKILIILDQLGLTREFLGNILIVESKN